MVVVVYCGEAKTGLISAAKQMDVWSSRQLDKLEKCGQTDLNIIEWGTAAADWSDGTDGNNKPIEEERERVWLRSNARTN